MEWGRNNNAAIQQRLNNRQNLSFAVDDDTLLLCFLLLPLIFRNSIEEILATTRVLYMLDTNVDPLCQDTTPVHRTANADKFILSVETLYKKDATRDVPDFNF